METTTYVRNIYKYYVAYKLWWTPASRNRRRANSWRRESRDASSDQSTNDFSTKTRPGKPDEKRALGHAAYTSACYQ